MPPAPTNEVADAALADELLAVALEAAAAAAELIHDRRPSSLTIESKSSDTDQVTQMDRASETLIREIVTDRRPHDVIVGEEGGRVPGTAGGDSEVTWWVDPIDGTTNYMYDHPGYNVSIAAAVGDVTVAAVVADPTHGRLYRARRGSGAFCNEDRLVLGPAAPLAGALVATGFGYDAERRGRQGAVVAALLPQIRDIRRMGAAALDLCSVASGRVDAFFEMGLSPWDLAAGALIASEAGARVGAVDGGPARPGSVLAAHPDLFGPLRDVLVSLGAGDV